MCSRTTASRRSLRVALVTGTTLTDRSLGAVERAAGESPPCPMSSLWNRTAIVAGTCNARAGRGHWSRAVWRGELEPADIRELSDCLADAKQNPDASFVVDLSAATASAPARLELSALIRRHADMQPSRRLSLLAPHRRSARIAAA